MEEGKQALELSADEERFCSLLDECAQQLRKDRSGHEKLELRIAGGWVRDKLLRLPSNDLDVAISSMTGQEFAKHFVDWIHALPPERTANLRFGRLTTIAARPDQSKHLETATTRLLGLDLDFVQLRSEEYGDSRIPEKVEFGTPLQDALRRDITINSLFYNVHTRLVEDQTRKGLDDLQSGYVRTPLPAEETFRDDPLRLLRCIRFASRFGFEIDADIENAAKDEPIRAAFKHKISRERVGTELEKMLKGRDPTPAISLISRLKLYSLVFSPPTTLEPKAGPSQSALSDAAGAAAERATLTLHELLHGGLDRRSLHPQLASLASASDTIRKRLYLAATLMPYRSKQAKVGKRMVWAGQLVIGDSLKLGNHDREYVSHLFAAAEKIAHPRLDRFGGDRASRRVAIGLLLRDPDVHDMKPGDSEAGLTWQASVLFSLVSELGSIGDDDVQRAELLAVYNAFVQAIVDLDLQRCLTPEFEKSRLDGKEICAALGIKPSKALASIIAKVVERQLAWPNETKAEATEWLKSEVAAGRIQTSQ